MKGFKNRLIATTLAISQVLMPITYIDLAPPMTHQWGLKYTLT